MGHNIPEDSATPPTIVKYSHPLFFLNALLESPLHSSLPQSLRSFPSPITNLRINTSKKEKNITFLVENEENDSSPSFLKTFTLENLPL